jgi:alcohol dehydrogenase YqhD (iron-dependent ADH family)
LSKEEKQIKDLMHQYMTNTYREARIKILDSLMAYGNKGIDAIDELIKVTGSDELIVYGLGIIKKIRVFLIF